MKHIWAPWRIDYIEMDKPESCFFCDKSKDNDDITNYILFRGKYNFIILNSFPYNPGHLLVSPFRHIANFHNFLDVERNEHFKMVSHSIDCLSKVFNPGGFNIGLNLSRLAGAGVVDHIHTHVVPRWSGDTNFMPVLSDTKVIPQSLIDTYRRLKEYF